MIEFQGATAVNLESKERLIYEAYSLRKTKH